MNYVPLAPGYMQCSHWSPSDVDSKVSGEPVNEGCPFIFCYSTEAQPNHTQKFKKLFGRSQVKRAEDEDKEFPVAAGSDAHNVIKIDGHASHGGFSHELFEGLAGSFVLRAEKKRREHD